MTKSALLFSRGVILVEGLAEQLMLPVMADRVGRPLAQAGVTVVNVDGLAFKPFIELFGADRLPIPCAVVSDSDPPGNDESDDAAPAQDTASEPSPSDVATADSSSEPSEQDMDSDEEAIAATLSPTAESLKAMANEHLGVFLAEKTFEWDLVKAGNWDVLLDSFARVKPRVSKRLRRDHVTSSWDWRADAFLVKVEDKKGRFAQDFAADAGDATDFKVPKHIEEAVFWTTIASANSASDQEISDEDADPTAEHLAES